MVIYQGKCVNWKSRFQDLSIFVLVLLSVIVFNCFLIFEAKDLEKNQHLTIIDLKNQNKSLKNRLNYHAFKEDENSKIEDILYYNKKIKDRIKSFNLGFYEKTYKFFDFPFKNIDESYTPFSSTEYGERNGSFHPAMDIQSPYDGNILSTGNGIVWNLGNNYYAGKFIVIYHNIDGEEFLSVYNHLSSVNVVLKQKIKKLEKIGIIGSTGKDCYGIHLHFALYKKIKTKWKSVNFVTNSLHKKRIEVKNYPIYDFLLK